MEIWSNMESPDSLQLAAADIDRNSGGLAISDAGAAGERPSYQYTSLRDVLPASSPPPLLSPVGGGQSGSWHDIPIKNSLLKQAAWAYLQPMPSPSSSSWSFVGWLTEKCECLGFLDAAVVSPATEMLGRIFAGRGAEEDWGEED